MYRNDYLKLYIDIIKEQVIYHDPHSRNPFVSSSPSNGAQTDKEGGVAWNPWDTHYGDSKFYIIIQFPTDLGNICIKLSIVFKNIFCM